MEIKKFIQIYDEVLPWNVLTNIIRFANVSKFEETRIGSDENGGKKDFNIRKAYALNLTNTSNLLSNVHWFNLLTNIFTKKLKLCPFSFFK